MSNNPNPLWDSIFGILSNIGLGVTGNTVYEFLISPAIKSILPRLVQDRDLQRAFASAFKEAIKRLMLLLPREDARKVLQQLHDDTATLFPIESGAFPNDILIAFLTGDETVLQQALWMLIGPYFIQESRDLVSEVKGRLPAVLGSAFSDIVNDDHYQKALVAFYRKLLQKVCSSLKIQAGKLPDEQKREFATTLAHMESLVGDSDLLRRVALTTAETLLSVWQVEEKLTQQAEHTETLVKLLIQTAPLAQEVKSIRSHLETIEAVAISPLDMTAARMAYIDSVLANYDAVTLPVGRADSLPLKAVFQPLRLRRDPLAAEDLEREERRKLLGERALKEAQISGDPSYSMSQVVLATNGTDALRQSPQRRMIVLGGPGTGKTTLLKDLLRWAAQEARKDPESQIPIFISLPNLGQLEQDLQEMTLDEYLPYVVKGFRVDERYARVLGRAISEGRAFLCLDGLDEVTPASRQFVIDMVNRGALHFGGTWVIGSRFTEYKGGQFQQGLFTEWELQPLDHALRRTLAERLLPVLESKLTRFPVTSEVTASVAESFTQAVEMHAQAAAWGENPLLFSLAAVVYVRLGALPLSRVQLYDEVVEAVLQIREPDKGRRGVLRIVLEQTALKFYQNRGRIFTLRNLLEILPDIRRRQDENWDTAEMSNRIVATGVLDVVAHETYGFRHQTFQEYLAAAALAHGLVSQGEFEQTAFWELALSKHTYSRWTEVLRLLVGVLVQQHSEKGMHAAVRWLRALADQQKNQESGDPGYLGLSLAISSLAEISIKRVTWQSTSLIQAAEEKLVTAWVKTLLEAIQYGHRAQINRLGMLARDIRRLDIPRLEESVNILVEALHDSNQDQQRSAIIWVLGQLGDRAPLQSLIGLLESDSRRDRIAAAKALGELGDRAPIDLLIRGLGDRLGETVEVTTLSLTAIFDNYGSLSEAAITALGQLGERVPIEPLVQLLTDNNATLRSAAARTLGQLGERVPIEPLVQALNDDNSQVRWAVITALGQLGERVPIEPLVQALNDDDSRVRKAAVEVLGHLGDRVPILPLISLMTDTDSHVRAAVASVINALRNKDESLEAFLQRVLPNMDELLEDADNDQFIAEGLWDPDPQVRIAAIGLWQLGKKSQECLPLEMWVHILSDENAPVRLAGVMLLKQLGRSAPQLFAELIWDVADDNDWQVRAAIVRNVLPQLDEGFRAKLIDSILSNENWEARQDVDAWQVRVALIETLRNLEGPAPIEAWIQLLRSDMWHYNRANRTSYYNEFQWEYQVRQSAAQAFGQIEPAAPFEPLMEALKQEDPRARSVALSLLREAGENVPVQLLTHAISDTYFEVREAAVELLTSLLGHGKLLAPTSPPWMKESLTKRENVPLLDVKGQRVSRQLLLRALTDNGIYVRGLAAQGLGQLGEQAPIGTLVRAVNDSADSVRVAAVNALGQLGERAPLKPIIRALRDNNQEVQEAAGKVLGQAGARAPVELLVQNLQDPNPGVRAAAVQALSASREQDTLEVVVQALKDASSYVRVKVLEALGQLGEDAPLEPLVRALDDEDSHVRENAVIVLARLGQRMPLEPLKRALNDPDASVRWRAVAALGHLHEKLPIEPLVPLLKDHNRKCRGETVVALEHAGARAPIEQLMHALDDDDWYVREKALSAMVNLRSYITIGTLKRALRDSGSRGRTAVVQLLGQVREPSAIEMLRRTLGDTDALVRLATVKALLQVEEEIPIKVVLDALTDRDAMVRREAVNTLSMLGGQTPVEALIQMLQDSDSHVRSTALRALTDLGDKVPVEALVGMLGDKDSDVRLIAVNSLSSLGDRTPEARLTWELGSMNDQVRSAVIWNLREKHGEVWLRVKGELELTLGNSAPILHSLTQSFIAEILGNMTHTTPDMLGTLTELLDWYYWEVRLQAVRALGQIRRNIPDRAIRRLIELRQDADSSAVREAADDALAEILSLDTAIEDD